MHTLRGRVSMRAQVDGVGTGCGYLVAGFLPGSAAPWSSGGVFMRCLVGGF